MEGRGTHDIPKGRRSLKNIELKEHWKLTNHQARVLLHEEADPVQMLTFASLDHAAYF